MTARPCLARLTAVLTALLALTTLAPPPAPAAAPITLLGVGEIPGTASDGLVLDPPVLVSPVTGEAFPHDRLGGMGSSIAYTGIGSRYVMTPDRGPADGTVGYLDRYYLFDIHVALGGSPVVTAALTRATLLTNEGGTAFTGLAAAFDASGSPASRRLDPEGTRVSPVGTLFVSDEYGPYLYEFDAAGRRLRVLPVPAKFLIAHPSASASGGLSCELPHLSGTSCTDGNNTSGRQSNRGMEGLAITPDGGKLYGLMQSPLIQDGALNASNARRGIYSRLLELDLQTGQTRELVYALESNRADGTSTLGTNEILAVSDVQFLVIERDGDAGAAAQVKKIYLVDIGQATDARDVVLPQKGALPAGVTPVSKTLFLDLLDPAFGLAGPTFPEKVEGLAWGPDLPDGRRLLLVTSDNDFFVDQPTRIFAFAVDASLVPGFQPQVLTPAAVVPGGGLTLKGKGRTPVAILSAGLFDATAVDPASVRLGGAAPARLGNGRPACSIEDTNGDGQPDLICHVETEQIAPQGGRVALEAFTDSGTPVRQWVPLR